MDPTLLRAFATLMTCVAAIAAVLWFVKRKTTRARVGDEELQMTVLARQNVGPKSQICMVRVANRVLVLGVTDTNVSFICDLNAPTASIAQDTASTMSAAQAQQLQAMATQAYTRTAPPTVGVQSARTQSTQPAQGTAIPGSGPLHSGAQIRHESLNPAFGPAEQRSPVVPDLSISGYLKSIFSRPVR